MRRCDRIETCTTIVLTLFVLMMVPLAGAFGTARFSSLEQRTLSDLQSRHQVSAVIVEDPRPEVLNASTSAPETRDYAQARWTTDGAVHEAKILTNPGAKSGDTTNIWVDADGVLAAAPRTGTENAVLAIGAAVTVLAMSSAGSLLVYLGVHWAVSRNRMTLWDREWAQVGKSPGWPVS